MKNIFSLLAILTAFSMWAVAKTPFPQQQAATTIQISQPSALSREQVDPSSEPNPTGVTTINQTDNNFISVYPNPATTYLNVSVISADENKVDIALYDVTGKLIKSIAEVPVESKAVRVNRDNLPSGVYFLVVKTSAGQQCRKVIFS